MDAALELDREYALLPGSSPELTEAFRRDGARGFWAKNLEYAQSDAQKRGVELPPGVLAFLHAGMGNGHSPSLADTVAIVWPPSQGVSETDYKQRVEELISKLHTVIIS